MPVAGRGRSRERLDRRARRSRRKRVLLASVLGTSLLLAATVLLLWQSAGYQRALLRQQGQAVLGLEYEFLVLAFGRVHTDLLHLAWERDVYEHANGAGGDPARLKRELELFLALHPDYDEVRIYAPERTLVARAGRGPPGRGKVGSEHPVPKRTPETIPETIVIETKSPDRERFPDQQFPGAALLTPGDVLVSAFRPKPGPNDGMPGPPILGLATLALTSGERPAGYVTLAYRGEGLLRNVSGIGRGFAGEVMIVSSHGEYLRAAPGRQARGGRPGHDEGFRADFPAAWDMLQSRSDGTFSTPEGDFAFQLLSPGQRYAPTGRVRGAHGFAAASGNGFFLVTRVGPEILHQRLYDEGARVLPAMALALLPVLLLAWTWAQASTQRGVQDRRLYDSEHRLRRLSGALLAAQEAERRSISRDLHDELGQQATAIAITLRTTASNLDGVCVPGPDRPNAPLRELRGRLAGAIAGMDTLIETLHALAFQLRPSVLDDLGLRQAVDSLVTELRERTGAQIECTVTGEPRKEAESGTGLSPTASENVYRIVQEALRNAVTHSGARRIRVDLRWGEERIDLAIEDDGRGFDRRRAGFDRLGILGMRERAELLNGTLELETRPGHGTRITVSIPCGQEPHWQ